MKRISIPVVTLFTFLASAQAQIITFDVPGAGTGPGQGTFAYVIAPGGGIAGNYIGANGVYHGFLRGPDGAITEFDVPGGGTNTGQGVIEVKGITPALEIVGTVMDATNVFHGFLRTRDGKFAILDAPDAGSGAFQGSGGLSVNPAGTILGEYFDASNVSHSFVRTPNGTIAEFDAPGAGIAPFQGTYPANLSGINPGGASVGEYVDPDGVIHGYLRTPDGTFAEFDDPNGQSTLSLGINPAGEVSGVYIDTNFVFHGYMRAPDGTITDYDVPGAGTGIFQGTNACWFIPCFGGINPAGTVTGFYVDSNDVYHGFLRTRAGKITTFDAPGAGTVGSPGGGQGTQPMTINPEGAITGHYTDANNAVHGFLRIP
jgi:hypothetical protein